MARLLQWGREMLHRRPVLTNTAVLATFYTGAELSQQTFNKYFTPEQPDIDLKAAAKVVTAGALVYAPSLYYWYRYLDRVLVGTAAKTVVKKVALEQFFMTPILLCAFYTVSGVLEWREDIFEELRSKYVKTLIANQSFWIPAQTVNFAFIPPHLRVVYVSCISFMWINVLCFIKRQKPKEISP